MFGSKRASKESVFEKLIKRQIHYHGKKDDDAERGSGSVELAVDGGAEVGSGAGAGGSRWGDDEPSSEIQVLVEAQSIVRFLNKLQLFTSVTIISMVGIMGASLTEHWYDEIPRSRTAMKLLIAFSCILLVLMTLLRHETPVNLLIMFSTGIVAAFAAGTVIGFEMAG